MSSVVWRHTSGKNQIGILEKQTMLPTLWNRWSFWGDEDYLLPIIACQDWEDSVLEDQSEEWEKALMTVLSPKDDAAAADSATDVVEERPVAHVQQTEAWDCGIACLLMAIPWLQSETTTTATSATKATTDALKSWMLQITNTESIWSMDLVCLLEEYRKEKDASFQYLFCTKTLQVDDEHKDIQFYQKAFEVDRVRVTRLFTRAQQEEWNLLQLANMGMRQLVNLVKRPDCLAIVLVDNAILMQHEEAYAGHYIVVSGVDNSMMRIHNPDSDRPVEFIAMSLFERAWKAKGTDNDVLFLVKR